MQAKSFTRQENELATRQYKGSRDSSLKHLFYLQGYKHANVIGKLV